MADKPWGGRFDDSAHPAAERFTASLPFDYRLWPYDLQGSEAWARALGAAKVLSDAEVHTILTGLGEIRGELKQGTFPFRLELEDIHMNIERRLIEKVGEVGGKLHTGRSRNDQVVLDVRLYLRQEIRAILEEVRRVQAALVARAEEHGDCPMPGYTHLQRAQPVLLAHHLLAYVFMFQRDRERLREGLSRVDILPLGSGALAGSAYDVDRWLLAELLGFSRISENSMDAVSDRDFILEFLGHAAILATHVSRLAGELCLWSTVEFGFVELPDAFATGSSLMPQKKNPDAAELMRGKAGRIYGHLVGLLAVMKGLPLTYHRDFQEDKEPLFDTVETLRGSLQVLAPLILDLRFATGRLRQTAGEHYATATDMADYLVAKGLPFRQAHECVGRVVRHAIEQGKRLEEIPLADLGRFSPLFDESVYRHITVEASLKARALPGGTAPAAVAEALATAKTLVEPGA